MEHNEKKDIYIFSLIRAFVGALLIQIGLPLVITLSISGSVSLGWRIAALIISTLFILGLFFSLLITGIDMIIEHSFPNKQFISINFALVFASCCITTLASYNTVDWFSFKWDIANSPIIFWITSIVVLIFSLYYSNRKIKGRIVEVTQISIKIDEFLNGILIKIKNNELSYGAAFTKVKKEIPEEFYRIKCTNKLLVAYNKLSYEEKRNDFEAYSKDKVGLLENYPLKFHLK